MSSDGLLKSVLAGFAGSVRIVRDAVASPAAFSAFLAEFGWTLAPAEITSVTTSLGDLGSLPDDTSSLSVEELADHLVAAGTAIRRVASSGAPAAFASSFPRELLDYLAYMAMSQGSPGVFAVLHFVGVLAERRVPADAATSRAEYTERQVHWDRLSSLVSDPAGTVEESYGWGDGFDGDAFLRSVGIVVRAFGGNAGVYGTDRALVDQYYAREAPQAAGVRSLIVSAPTNSRDVRLALLALPIPPSRTTTTPVDGFALMPVITGTAADTIALTDRVKLKLGGDVLTRPVRAEVHRGSAVVRATPGDSRIDARARLDAQAPAAAPWLAFGDATSSRLEIAAAHASLGFRGTLNGDLELEVEVGLDSAALVIDLGDGDSFVQSSVGNRPVRSAIALGGKWSSKSGFALEGQPRLALTLPVAQSLGDLVRVTSVGLALGAADGGVALDTTISAGTSLGPIDATIADVGVRALLKPVDGNLGNVDLQFGFKPPTGVGLVVDAGPVTGGGSLVFDPEHGQYAGEAQLQFENIGVRAFGLLTTRLPGGRPGFSLLVIVQAEFPPVQLGMGFMLVGVGGLLGINRTVSVEALRAGLKTGALGAVLSPPDPKAGADQLVATLSGLFPPAPGRHVFAPTARIVWGSPTLITIDLALILELPSPVRLVALGRLRALLPDERDPIVRLQVDVLGVIDFDQKTAAVDATLVDSRLAQFALTGDLALRMGWGDNSTFLLAVGGFHPRFAAPPGFPALDRVAIALASGDNPKLRLEAYLALTSNTVQFGSRVDLAARAGSFSIAGFLSFDALVTLAPLAFVVDIAAKLAVKLGSRTLLSVSLALTLSGPRPWRARGRASFSILFFDVSFGFDVTIGDSAPAALPSPVDVAPLLAAAFADARAWTAQLPAGSDVVTLRALEPGTTVLAHPLATLQVRQRVAPLDRTLERFGTSVPSGAKRFHISLATIGGTRTTITPLQDRFAPAQFTAMSDDAKLSAPSFEAMNSGAALGADGYAAGTPITVNLVHEQQLVTAAGIPEPKPQRVAMPADVFATLTATRPEPAPAFAVRDAA